MTLNDIWSNRDVILLLCMEETLPAADGEERRGYITFSGLFVEADDTFVHVGMVDEEGNVVVTNSFNISCIIQISEFADSAESDHTTVSSTMN